MNLKPIKASDILEHQYLTHAHSHITRAVAAMDSWLGLVCPHHGYAMLMRFNKAETAVHGYHCPGDMAVRMRKALARPWIGVRVCHSNMNRFRYILHIISLHGKI